MIKKIAITSALLFSIFFLQAQYITDNIVAYYPFNGNAFDESGNGYDATVNGPVLVTDRFGNINSAYYFDGYDDFMKLPDEVRFQPLTSSTVCFWLKTMQNTRFDLFSQRIGNFKPSEHNFGITFNSSVYGLQYTHPNYNYENTTINNAPINTLLDGEWHSFAFVKDVDNSLMIVYMDNIKIVEESIIDVNYIVQGELIIGTDINNNVPFNGLLDEIRIYNHALSESEIYGLLTFSNEGYRINNESVNIYPNPSKGFITIDTELDIYSTEIINFTGKVMYKSVFSSLVNISDLPSGIYVLLLKDKNGITLQSQKIIKS